MSTVPEKSPLSKKELRDSYRERTVVGGVYAIRNTATGRMLLASAANLQSAHNRFAFAKDNPTSLNLKLLPDIKEYGIEVFAFEVLEELEKKPEQNNEEFAADLEVLLELWQDKVDAELRY